MLKVLSLVVDTDTLNQVNPVLLKELNEAFENSNEESIKTPHGLYILMLKCYNSYIEENKDHFKVIAKFDPVKVINTYFGIKNGVIDQFFYLEDFGGFIGDMISIEHGNKFMNIYLDPMTKYCF